MPKGCTSLTLKAYWGWENVQGRLWAGRTVINTGTVVVRGCGAPSAAWAKNVIRDDSTKSSGPVVRMTPVNESMENKAARAGPVGMNESLTI